MYRVKIFKVVLVISWPIKRKHLVVYTKKTKVRNEVSQNTLSLTI